MRTTEVVVVGGGIAGSSLACALAPEGLEVTVLEATERYEDRVRGEQMHAWGVKEARDLGVEQVLLDAGAHVSRVWRQYVEGAPGPAEIDVSTMVPGVAGTLNLRHPDACQALSTAAAEAGATVVRGVRDVRFATDDSVTVAYDAGNRPARRMWLGQRMATMDAQVASLMRGAFAGPELIPDEAVDPTILDRIRAA